MKILRHLPVYAGLVTLVLAVLVSSIQLGSRATHTNTQTEATNPHAALSLTYAPPDILSVLVSSEREIGGVEVTLAFDKDQIVLLPSTLSGGDDFVAQAGELDRESGLFRFSAVPQREGVTGGIVAQLAIQRIGDGSQTEVPLVTLVTQDQQSGVWDRTTNHFISVDPVSVRIDIPH